jgi:hypothetical protein
MNTYQITGTVYKLFPKDKYSQVVLKYLSGSKEQYTPFNASNPKVNQEICDLQPGSLVTIEFQVGGNEYKERFYSNNWAIKILN